MDYIPNINLIDLHCLGEIIALTRGCWQRAAVHLDIVGAGLKDFIKLYGFSCDTMDYKYCCDKYYDFICRRNITTQLLVNAFWHAGRKDICYRIRDIITPKIPMVTDPLSELKAEIKQLKETIAIRDKEIENNAAVTTQLCNIVSGVAKIVL